MLTIVAGPPAVGKSTMFAGRNCLEFDEWVQKRYGKSVTAATSEYRKEYPRSNNDYLEDVYLRCKNNNLFLVDTFIYRADRIIAVDYLINRGVKEVNLIYVISSLQTAIDRNRTRKNPLKEDVIMDMWVNQEFPKLDEGFSSIKIISSE